jgi:actin related protein 2/3 complex subunit 4
MATAQQPYFDCIKRTLHAALCLTSFPSQVVERHNKPEVEAQSSPELMLNPILICRDDQERVLIESSVNSVRVSICFRHGDGLGDVIAKKYVGFLAQRAIQFHILRRKPIPGYDISFLITNEEAETMHKHKCIDFIIQFIADIDKDLTSAKLNVNQRLNRVAADWFQEFQ